MTRKRHTPLIVGFAAVLALLGGLGFALFLLVGGTGTSFHGLLDSAGQILESIRFQGHLEERSAGIRHSTNCKREIINEVLADRLGLLEAARAFSQVDRADGTGGNHSLFEPVSGPEEVLCLSVLSWAKWELIDDPPRCAAVLARLQAEFRNHFPGPDAARNLRLALGTETDSPPSSYLGYRAGRRRSALASEPH
jgi:hypothetical protein